MRAQSQSPIEVRCTGLRIGYIGRVCYNRANFRAGLHDRWAGDLVPSDTVTISLATRVVRGTTTVWNHFTGEVVGYGLFKSQAVTTAVDPIQCYLPLIYRNYCSGPLIDDFSTPASGWPIAETTYWSYGYIGGEYRFYAKQSAFGAVSRGDKTGRFIVEVDARQVSAVNGSFGLVFQVNDDWSDLYTFEIYPATQEWAIFRRLGNQSKADRCDRPFCSLSA